jgi:hypothetical protein
MNNSSFNDKNGTKIKINDIVLLDVFESKLKHEKITTMLGKVSSIDYDYSTFVIDLGSEFLSRRGRKGHALVVANCFKEEFQEQIKTFDQIFMLYMLES